MSEESQQETRPGTGRDSIFFRKIDKDIWEAWSWTAMGLLATSVIVWVVAFAKLGYPSVLCWGVGIPLTYFMAIIIILWGLVKSLLNPPIFRVSRSVAFVSLLVVTYFAKLPDFVAPVSTEDWVSAHTYTLPFEGDWYVIAGGETREHNPLVTSPAMRFGYIFTHRTPGKESFEGDPYELSSYPCYGKPLLAPADGEVVDFYDTAADNVPGKSSDKNILGNYLIFRVGEQEDLIMAYLKQGSVAVKPGEPIKRGQKLAECGNSGATTEPAVLMYLVKDSSKLVVTEGLPLQFSNYEVVGGDRVVKGIPRGEGAEQDAARGQTVRAFTP